MRVRDKRRGLNAALEQVPAVAEAAGQQLVRGGTLVEFAHGLGDLVQFGAVLAHLKDANPALQIDVAIADEKVLAQRDSSTAGSGSIRRNTGPAAGISASDSISRTVTATSPGSPRRRPTVASRSFSGWHRDRSSFATANRTGPMRERLPRNISPHIAGQADAPNGRFPVVCVHYQGRLLECTRTCLRQVAAEISSTARLRGQPR